MIWGQIILNALITACLAGAMASLVSLGIEKLGGSLGGILGGIPSTIVPAVWGLWITIASSVASDGNEVVAVNGTLTQQEVVDFQKCMFMTPSGLLIDSSLNADLPGMLLNGLFLYSWRIVPGLILRCAPSLEHRKYSFLLVIILCALSFWFCIAISLVFLNDTLATKTIPADELALSHNATSTTFIVTRCGSICDLLVLRVVRRSNGRSMLRFFSCLYI